MTGRTGVIGVEFVQNRIKMKMENGVGTNYFPAPYITKPLWSRLQYCVTWLTLSLPAIDPLGLI